MKKLLVAMLLAQSAVSFAGFSDSNKNMGGFSGGQKPPKPTTVAEALKAWDDTPVTLTGHITRQVERDEFYFKDATGEIRIEVEDYAWNGQNITPKDEITIQGKVDKNDWGHSEIEVYNIHKH